MFNMIFVLILLALVGAVVVVNVKSYRASTSPTVPGKLFDMFKQSATVLWGYATAATGMLMALAMQGGDLINVPEIRTFITNHLSADGVAMLLAGIGVITMLLRMRSGSNQPLQ